MTVTESLLRTPIGYNMQVLSERLAHVKDLLDLHSWRVIFDIGAMDGWEGTNFARVLPDARVWAFEASAANCERCTKTYMTQPYAIRSRLSLSHVALTDVTGPLQFHAVDEQRSRGQHHINVGMGSMLRLMDPDMWPWEHNAQQTVQVKGYRLDDYCAEAQVPKIDVIWMDVQGAELKVLQGAGDLLQDVQVIFTEAGLEAYYEGHTLKPEIDVFLAAAGFVEIESARQQAHRYEVNTIYVNTRFLRRDQATVALPGN